MTEERPDDMIFTAEEKESLSYGQNLAYTLVRTKAGKRVTAAICGVSIVGFGALGYALSPGFPNGELNERMELVRQEMGAGHQFIHKSDLEEYSESTSLLKKKSLSYAEMKQEITHELEDAQNTKRNWWIVGSAVLGLMLSGLGITQAENTIKEAEDEIRQQRQPLMVVNAG